MERFYYKLELLINCNEIVFEVINFMVNHYQSKIFNRQDYNLELFH